MLSFDRFDNTVRFYLFHFYVLYCSRYQSANTIYYNSNFFDYRFDVVVLINLNIYIVHPTQKVLSSATLSNEIFCCSFLVKNHFVCVPSMTAK